MKREFLTTLLPNVGTEVINRIPAEHFCVGDRIKLSTVNARKDSLIRAYLQDTVCPALPQQWKVMIKKVRVRDF